MSTTRIVECFEWFCSCYDGQQNGDELSIDCGGSVCSQCTPTPSPSAIPAPTSTAGPTATRQSSANPTASPSPTPSSDIYVNVYADSADGDCTTPGTTTCNLRAAIVESELRAAIHEDVVVQVPTAQTHALNGGLGDLYVTWAVTVESLDPRSVVTVDGSGNGGRFMQVSGSGANVTFGDGFKWTGFDAGTGYGGVFYVHGFGASLTIGDDCEFSSNEAHVRMFLTHTTFGGK